MIVSGWGAAGHVTISDNEFDGRSTWSAGCNGKHYWTALLIGLKDWYTLSGNYFHDLSGRAPHIGTTATSSAIVMHAVNNYFEVYGIHFIFIAAFYFVLELCHLWHLLTACNKHNRF